ncbi:MAG: hypothetical protein JO368_12510, partial [Acidimicrobiales bacterium]|nr:hypothetical protein [Acidimicrobiales bacterium]
TDAKARSGEGRAKRSGLRRVLNGGACVLLLGLAAGCGAAADATQTTSNNNTYGGLPSWLPKSSVPINRVQVATVRHSVLADEGDTVRVELPKGQTEITLVGPTVPPFVAPPPPTTLATFTVTLSHTTGTVPIVPTDFALVDGAGQLHFPTAFVGAGTPSTAPRGNSVAFQLQLTMATGAGSLRWAPGGHTMVVYDFTVEND